MDSAGSSYAIETINLTKIFPDWWGRPKVKAVVDLNLKVRYNEIYGFLGPNGSGKTTTIKMLLNLLHPTKGHAFVLGGRSTDPAIAARIGYLPEESYLYRYLTARETLDFYGRIFGLPASVRKSRIDTLLEMVGLAGLGSRRIGTYSKGMMRRIGLAQALINDPDLLILDEPTSGMDPIGTRQIKDLLLELARRGKTILLCSHLLADVEDVCDRIGIMYGGKMQVEGPVRELLQHRDELQILTGPLPPKAREEIESVVRREGSWCKITTPVDKLETFFVNIITKAQETQPTSGAKPGTGIQGFLAAQPASPSRAVLEQLVAKKPQPVSESSADRAKTEPTEAVPPSAPKKELLEHLTEKPVEKTVSAEAQTEKPSEPPAVPKPAVRQDILEKLLGGRKGPDGSTEQTRLPDSEERRDAE
ncbi:MAG TPA: ATP-binding cassette domain-containing protein [Anaerohalosphaeraceae bacterium]|nr:ATP-binding cassette domain-containing protein [Anaerohalosphaeraceae bacterium]HOL88678.1 ATP-binding cassette domain-containing protein [Anaerohalosphaeraceae bacterium]HPP57041.1 ATP-binding cassette domain-containing protein [Anaerohalosphaeraceae bacterium]